MTKCFYIPPLGRNVLIAGAGTPVPAPTPVYRIEMANGRGPYNSGLPNAEEIYWTLAATKPGFDCTRLAEGEQCGFTEARFYQAHGDASYGCSSREALCQWFPKPARDYLAAQGAELVEYVLPKGAPLEPIHNGEVLFDRAQAHCVAKAPLSSLDGKAR